MRFPRPADSRKALASSGRFTLVGIMTRSATGDYYNTVVAHDTPQCTKVHATRAVILISGFITVSSRHFDAWRVGAGGGLFTSEQTETPDFRDDAWRQEDTVTNRTINKMTDSRERDLRRIL